jgi:NDP-sugar pyrophosphorylase family protein
MKAVILAAGEGTRLSPLTNVRPKPMLPVANRPVLEHVVDAVAAAGVEEVVLVVGYKRERIQSHFGDGGDFGVDITYAVQETQLGTGDALLRAERFVGDDFLVLNGDKVVGSDVVEALVERRRATGDAAMAVADVDEPELYGVVEAADGEVTGLTEKPPAREAASSVVNAGAYAFGPDVFAVVRRTDSQAGELSLVAALQNYMADRPIQQVRYDGPWLDVTRPWDLVAVNGRLIDADGGRATAAAVDPAASVADATAVADSATVAAGAVVGRGTSLGPNASVGPNAVVENSVVMTDATVDAGAVVRDCVVAENARVGAGSVAAGGTADVVVGDDLHRDVRFGGIVGDNAHLGGNVTLAPGARVGNDATVEGGVLVDDDVPSGGDVRRG